MKKHISLLLAVLMIITMLPMGVVASGTLAAPKVSDSNGTELAGGTAVISTVEGELTLTFAEDVVIDSSKLGGITIVSTTEDKEFKGALVPTARANTIKLKFGRLDAGNYKLTVPATVGTADNTLASQFEFAFAANEDFMTKVDFSEDKYKGETPTFTSGTDNLMYLNGAWTTVGTDAATVVSDNGNSYMQITVPKNAQYGIYLDPEGNYDFNSTSNVDDDRVVVIDADLGGKATDGAAYIGAKAITNGTGISLGVLTNANTDIYNTAVAGLSKDGVIYTAFDGAQGGKAKLGSPLTKTGDWYKTRLVIRREESGNESGKLATDLYNYVTDNYAFIGTDDYYIPANKAVNQIGIMGAYINKDTILKYDYIYARPDRLLSVLSCGNYTGDTDTGSVTINMSDDMLDSSLGSITVKRGDTAIENVSVNKTADGRGITLTFEGGLSASEYTVSLDGVKSSNGLNIYSESKTATFSVDDSNTNVSPYIATPSVASGTISTIEGRIRLEFGVDIDPDTISGITFKKADDTEIDGKYFVTANGRTITVRFGDLVDGQNYVLTLPNTVKDTEGHAVNAATYTYTAQKKFLTNTDFSDYTTDSTKAVEGKVVNGADNIYYTDNWNNTPASSITAVATENDTYVELTGINGSNGAGIAIIGPTENGKTFNFNTTDNIDKDKVYIVETDLTSTQDGTWGGSKFSSNSGSWQNNRIASIYGTGLSGTSVVGMAVLTNGVTASSDRTAKYTLPNGGWFKPTMVMRRGAGEDTKLYSDLYYRHSGVAEFIGTDADTVAKATSFDAVALAGRGYSKNPQTIKITYAAAYPERLLSIIGDDGYTKAAKGITLYTTKVVKAGTEDAIVIKKDGNIVPVSDISIGADGRSLTVTFAGTGLVAGSYDVYMSNDTSTVLDTAGIKAYEGEAYAFEVSEEEATKILSLSGNTAPEGNIDVDTEKIELTFGDSLAEDAINGVDFTKADGTPIKGIVDKKVEGNKLILTFGRLENKERYKLEIKEDAVKSADGKCTAEADSVVYMAVEKYEVYQDFSNAALPEGTQPYGNDTATNWGGENIKVEISGDAELKTDEAGDSYLEIGRKNEGRYGLYLRPEGASNFNSIFLADNTDGKVLAFDIKLKESRIVDTDKTEFGEPLLNIFNTNTSVTDPIWKPLMFGGTDTVSAYTEYGKLENYLEDKKYTMEKEADTGYTHATAVLKAVKAGDESVTVDMSIFDAVAGKDIGKLVRDDTKLYKYDNLNWVRLAGRFYDGDALKSGVENNRLQITEFSVIHANAMDILKSYEYTSASRTISVAMSDDVSEASLENIKVTKDGAEGEPPVITDASYDEATRTVTVSFPYGLAMGNYTLDVNGLSSARGFNDGKMETIPFVVGEGETYITTPVFKSGEKTIVTEVKDAENEILLTAATSVTVSATIGNQPENIVIFLGVFDASNNLVKVEKATIGEDGKITAECNGITAGSASSARLFIWEDFENIRPLFDPVCL